MRIVIDLQGAQTRNRTQPIGRYALAIARALVCLKTEHEIILALSGLLPETIEPVRAAFDDVLDQGNIRVWYAPGPVREKGKGNAGRRRNAELIREAFLASLNPDVVFVPSFFEGLDDDGVTSIGLFASQLVTVVALDSLEPLSPEKPATSKSLFGLRKAGFLKRADGLIALSPVSGEALQRVLGTDRLRILSGTLMGGDEDTPEVWEAEAGRLLQLFEDVSGCSYRCRVPSAGAAGRKPRLAYVSPLPPEASGISDYSSELLPELCRFYEIDVILAQKELTDSWVMANCPIRTVEWFVEHAERYDRVFYHFGNSPFHLHMFDLLATIPGVIVLHDFGLSDIQYYREFSANRANAFNRALFRSHGYGALLDWSQSLDAGQIVTRYPMCLDVLESALGVIVHSEHPRHLGNQWFGEGFSADWRVIPLLRLPCPEIDRMQARRALGLKPDVFVVCTFGFLGRTKLNHRLLDAWLGSALLDDKECLLFFVGGNEISAYGQEIVDTIGRHGNRRIRITGRVDLATYRNYLAATDLTVQLRGNSRGETSAAVLDCLNFGLPCIVNANGFMAELPPDAVCLLPDAFETADLTKTLEMLRYDETRRMALGRRGQSLIRERHAPAVCAQQYAEAIESFYTRLECGQGNLIRAIVDVDDFQPTDVETLHLANSIAKSLPGFHHVKQLLIDVSVTCRNDLKTGIQRVVRALVSELIQAPPPGYRVEPVYLSAEGDGWAYRYARHWTLDALGIVGYKEPDEVVEFLAGDRILIADYTGDYVVQAENAGLYNELKIHGVGLHFVAFDLLPTLMPQYFPPDTDGFKAWLATISRVADSVTGISRTVAEDIRQWVAENGPARTRPLKTGWFHLGADVQNSFPTTGRPENATVVLSTMASAPSFLMVGTLEPRKGYLQVIAAFSLLWARGVDVNLVIAGREGWQGLPDELRRTIPEIMRAMKGHPEFGRRLVWLDGVSDEFLEDVYGSATALIAASMGEGFGLPLIEAAQHGVPLIVRDIPVFREVAGEYACYFNGETPENLANVIIDWLELERQGRVPQSRNMAWQTWRQSAAQLIQSIL